MLDTGGASDQETSETLSEGAVNDDADDAAVVQAFVASTNSNQNSKGSSAEVVKFGDWSFEQINTWIGETIELAFKADSREAGARLVWQRWSAADRYLPQGIRTQLVQFIDNKLMSKGFPSLRQLVS